MREHLLYKREKNFVFSFIFKFSLSILELLFRDNFTKIKQKLKKILEKSKKITFQIFNHFFLIFKYPKYYKLPYGHLNSIDKTLFFIKIVNDKKIKLFLIGGTLLGAVRQNAFAGRPTDVDLGIFEKDERKIRNKFKKFINNGASLIRSVREKDGRKKIQIVLKSVFIDLHIFKIKRVKNKNVWSGDSGLKKHILLQKSQLLKLQKVKLYDLFFLSPKNPEKYLRLKYGIKWSKPDKKQFSWKTGSFIGA